MPRFDDLPLRFKLLITAAIPVAVVVVAVLTAFEVGLGRVRESAVPRQQLVQTLNAQSFDYLSEVREYLVEGEASTLDEIELIRQQLQASSRELAGLAFDDPTHGALVDSIQLALGELLTAGGTLSTHRPTLNGESPDARNGEGADGADGAEEEQGTPKDEALGRLEDAEQALTAALANELRLADREIFQAFQRFQSLAYGAGALGLLAAGLVALLLAMRINRPLSSITAASQRFAQGELSARVMASGSDEIGLLARAFNEMADEQQSLVQALQTNLEALQATQDQLLQSGKLAAVGQLAAGVAHEINNPLSAVLTYTLLIRERYDELPAEARQHFPKLQRRLELVETAALRCKAIADNLLLFARKETREAALFDLRTMLEGAFDLLVANLRHHRVRLMPQLADDLPMVQGHPDQLQQVIVNLVSNAQQAMAEGGTVIVSATPIPDGSTPEEFDPDESGLGSSDVAGPAVTIQIVDDGPGIPPEIRDRIFDPFFTTKPAGQGTGLGLSIVYGIVQRHGGTIRVDCPDAGGTRFTIRLPATRASATQSQSAESSSSKHKVRDTPLQVKET